jgi:CheY-like chemotaxis protein
MDLPVEGRVRGRVLIIDDEPIVGQAFGKVLGREHDVTVLANPREALATLAGGEVYDVIFCEVSMPAMTGLGFHAELERVAPRMAAKIVFVTGSAWEATSNLLGTVPNMVLSKPFAARVIREVAREFVQASEPCATVSRSASPLSAAAAAAAGR